MRFVNEGTALSMWDFADAILGALGGALKPSTVASPPQKPACIVASFVERSERHQERKDRKVESAKVRKQESELAECTFHPKLDSKPSSSTHARYLDPRPARPPYVSKVEEDVFGETLRAHEVMVRKPPRGIDAVSLDAGTRKRLDEAEAFYSLHKERMELVRAEFTTTIQQEKLQHAA